MVSGEEDVACASQIIFSRTRIGRLYRYRQRYLDSFSGAHLAPLFGLEKTVRYQLEKGDRGDLMDGNGRSPLSYAAERGHNSVVKLLVTWDDIEVNSRDTSGDSPLSLAVMKRHEVVVSLLLARGDVDINWRDPRDRSLLSCAAGTAFGAKRR